MNFLQHLQTVREEADTLFCRSAVEMAIRRVAAEITARIGGDNPILLTVLNGGIIFCGNLLLELPFPLELDSVSVGRYRGETRGADLRWNVKPTLPLRGRTVLLVDDVLDEGLTLAELKRYCLEQGAEKVLIAVLVEKKLAVDKPCRADFIGVEADNRYLFGYGMDYRNYLRNAAGIFACSRAAEAS